MSGALAADALSVRVRGRALVDRVSFEVRSGQIVAAIGPNGAGETTLVEARVGVRRRSGGVVRAAGRALRIADRVLCLAEGRSVAFGSLADIRARSGGAEGDILFFRVFKGKRTVFDDVRGAPTASKAWHTLALKLRGRHLTVSLDGQDRLEKTLEFTPSGRVGLWSKADSQVLFDDLGVTSLGGSP